MSLRGIYYLWKSFDTLKHDRDSIERFQAERMDSVRSAAAEITPYSEFWEDVPGSIDKVGDVHEFPVMERDRFPETEPGEAAETVSTSGTTTRRSVGYDPTAAAWTGAVQFRAYLLQGYRPFRRVAKYHDEEPDRSLPGRIFLPHARIPPESSVEEQAEWLVREDPPFIHHYPQTLFAIAKYLEHSHAGVELSLRAVFTHGQVLTPHMRETMEETFGAEVHDQYGTAEFGVAAWECPEEGGYHISEDLVYPEVLGEDGEKVKDGGTGELVLTTLVNTDTPLFRYGTGDLVELSGEGCICDCSFRKLSRIRGREENVLTSSEGEEVHPDEVINVLSRSHDLLTFQIFPEGQGFQVRYVPNDGFREDSLEKLRDRLESELALAPVRFEEVDRIERTPGGKIPAIAGDESLI